MITKDDWNNALDVWVDEERRRLGGPPSPVEVVAYLSGTLSGADAARVRALLVYYPELTPLLNERIEKPLTTRQPSLQAIAAALSIAALTTLLVREQRRNAEPVIHSSRHELVALHARGPAISLELPAGQEHYLISIVAPVSLTDAAYEIEIVRGSDVLWTATGARPIDDTFDVSIPGRFLTPGTYTLNVYALRGERKRIVEHYMFRVKTP